MLSVIVFNSRRQFLPFCRLQSLRFTSNVVPDLDLQEPQNVKKIRKVGPSLRDFLATASTEQKSRSLRITPSESHPYITKEMTRGGGMSGY